MPRIHNKIKLQLCADDISLGYRKKASMCVYAINWLQPKNRSFHLSSKCAGFSKKYIGGTKNSYHMYLAVNIMKMVESSDAEWSSNAMIILHLGKGHVHDQSNVLCDMIKLLPIAVNPLYGNIECRVWKILQLLWFCQNSNFHCHIWNQHEKCI